MLFQTQSAAGLCDCVWVSTHLLHFYAIYHLCPPVIAGLSSPTKSKVLISRFATTVCHAVAFFQKLIGFCRAFACICCCFFPEIPAVCTVGPSQTSHIKTNKTTYIFATTSYLVQSESYTLMNPMFGCSWQRMLPSTKQQAGKVGNFLVNIAFAFGNCRAFLSGGAAHQSKAKSRVNIELKSLFTRW